MRKYIKYSVNNYVNSSVKKEKLTICPALKLGGERSMNGGMPLGSGSSAVTDPTKTQSPTRPASNAIAMIRIRINLLAYSHHSDS